MELGQGITQLSLITHCLPLVSCCPPGMNWDIFLTLLLRLLVNVLLEHGGLPCVFPFAVHLDLGTLCETQGYLWQPQSPGN